jgi:hypothetical protein
MFTNPSPTRAARLAVAAAAGVLALGLAACGNDDQADQNPASTATTARTVDAEDYTAGPAVIVFKRVDPNVTEKVTKKTTCKKKNKKNKAVCDAWNYKTKTVVTDDEDQVFELDNGYDVDVDQATFDGYGEGDTYPRPTS